MAKVRREGRCRCCGLEGLPTKLGGQLNRAHLVSRGAGGDDVDDNIIPLCGSGTTGCHGAFDGQTPVATSPSLLRGWGVQAINRRVWSLLTLTEVYYVTKKKGMTWAGRRFQID